MHRAVVTSAAADSNNAVLALYIEANNDLLNAYVRSGRRVVALNFRDGTETSIYYAVLRTSE